LAAWLENIPAVRAEELLRDHHGELTPEQLYAALVLTGVDRRKADYERSLRALERMRQSSG
jgi:hypothetical protein